MQADIAAVDICSFEKFKSCTQAGVVALRGVLDDLKKKAGEVAEKIKQLEVKTYIKIIRPTM